MLMETDPWNGNGNGSIKGIKFWSAEAYALGIKDINVDKSVHSVMQWDMSIIVDNEQASHNLDNALKINQHF